MRKRKVAIASIIAAILIALLIAYPLRNSIALRLSGMDPADISVLWSEMDMYDRPFRVIKAKALDQDAIVLAHSHLNPLGIWTIGLTSVGDDKSASIAWGKPKGSRIYGQKAKVGFEQHSLYYGLNAKQWIEIAPEDIERNVAVDIVQDENEFWIHFVSFDDAELLNGEWLDALLKKAVG